LYLEWGKMGKGKGDVKLKETDFCNGKNQHDRGTSAPSGKRPGPFQYKGGGGRIKDGKENTCRGLERQGGKGE